MGGLAKARAPRPYFAEESRMDARTKDTAAIDKFLRDVADFGNVEMGRDQVAARQGHPNRELGMGGQNVFEVSEVHKIGG